MTATTGVQRSTGKDREEWFALLDDWGGRESTYQDTARWLRTEHGLSAWWAQKLTVEYEQSRGLRAPGVRSDGTFTATASKTLAVPLQRAHQALVEPADRQRWLPNVPMPDAPVEAGRTTRIRMADGSRLAISLAGGETKTQVAVEHSHLPSAAAAEGSKVLWRRRLAELKGLVEGGAGERTAPA